MADTVATMPSGGARLPAELEAAFEQQRPMLAAHCYRMLGSAFEADDALQETRVRAWRAFDRFEGRAAVTSWLYRIATNVCLDMLQGRNRRARPMDLGPAEGVGAVPGPTHPESTWVEPMPDSRMFPEGGDPAEQAVERETVRLAFVAALQNLPPRQRAVLILREVLRWRAAEVAELLETSVASVNSSLQRARATLADLDVTVEGDTATSADVDDALLDRYVDAFERYDLDALVGILHEDATMSMPPYALWLRGADAVRYWLEGPGHGCRGSRLVPTRANGLPAFGQYRPGPDGGFEPWSLQLVETTDGRVTAIHSFLDTPTLFPIFGLPERLDGEG